MRKHNKWRQLPRVTLTDLVGRCSHELNEELFGQQEASWRKARPLAVLCQQPL